MRVFLDTKILIAAFATRGICADLLRCVLAKHKLVTGKPVLREFRRALTEKLGVPAINADQVIPFLREHADVSEPCQQAPWPDDRWVVASALDTGADVLVTRDPTLLALTQHALHITDPRGFWELVRRPL